MKGKGASCIAIQNGRVVIAGQHYNRLHTDGSTGGLPLKGAEVGYSLKPGGGYGGVGNEKKIIGPSSAAFSPDGKTVYFTGIMWGQKYGLSGSVQGVLKVNYETDEAATEFVGKNNYTDFGASDNQLSAPSSVDTDSQGNVYISDFCNNRVQIFNASGKLLSSIKVNKPAKVWCINYWRCICLYLWFDWRAK
jgi:sugar lactone lactonase YvrE